MSRIGCGDAMAAIKDADVLVFSPGRTDASHLAWKRRLPCIFCLLETVMELQKRDSDMEFWFDWTVVFDLGHDMPGGQVHHFKFGKGNKDDIYTLPCCLDHHMMAHERIAGDWGRYDIEQVGDLFVAQYYSAWRWFVGRAKDLDLQIEF